MRLILFVGKCLVGFLASVGLIVVALGVLAGYGWQEVRDWRTAETPVPERAVLTLDLSSGVAEQAPRSPIAGATDGGVPIHRAIGALEHAAGDDRVRAVAMRVGRGGLAMGHAQELRNALQDFRDSGKTAWAFAETLSGGGMGGGTLHAYLASAFDRVWLQPSGDVNVSGFLLESPYIADALAEIGVEPRLDQRREFKGIKDRFTAMRMPEPQRTNRRQLLQSWMDQVVAGIAQGRGLAPQQVRQLVEEGNFSAERALQAGLVDQLGYRDQMRQALRQAVGAQADDRAAMVDLLAYGAQMQRARELPEDTPQIAVVTGQGAVTLGSSQGGRLFGDVQMGSDTIAPALLEAARDDKIKAIVLRVDSPGGSYVASDTIWHAVRRAREMGTPVVVSMANIAASGGYFVAAPANRIYALPGTITGSIGVGSGKFVLTGLWDKLEINFDGVQAGRNADFWSPNHDFTEAQWQKLQTFLDQTYADFKQKVASGRDLSPEQVEQVAQGKIWSGADAQARGLVDQLGGLEAAIAGAKELAEIPAGQPVRVVERPERKDPLRRLIEGALQGRIESPAAEALGRIARGLRPLIDVIGLLQGRQAERRLESPVQVEDVR
ncbi:signal peptide peptidase SppA [Rhodovibrio sodomensis]|nr:signal peptide peptidase SppA [Rhodovibrio sodomensis]